MAEHHHGHTPAAWTGVIIAFIGFIVACGFTIAAIPAGFWAGIGIIFVGAAAGGVMHLMGMGQKYEPVSMSKDVEPAEQADRVHAGA
ncbi:HGxxPAAW family protein [Streptomyces sp. HPF1205]|uniref:HGxxPAAW family protein n=1 Tax=Streptomyces sp. HPF1205 TaxID=2873262 RepID=UPI001CEC8B78|nr:HGxxPAAW family protein [Streptomyces sp. HPF1205]